MRGGALLVEHNPRGLEHKVFAVTQLRAPQRSDRILLLVHLVRRSVLLLDPQRGPKTGPDWWWLDVRSSPVSRVGGGASASQERGSFLGIVNGCDVNVNDWV